ncbi:MAG: hypothetical protein CMH57_12040, partial [Myxococcales bacterium]|nr:hypothetical protein [Myxococcales bacterium]
IAAAKARAKANQDDMRARVKGGGGGGGGGGDKPMSREEKIAAAKARAKAAGKPGSVKPGKPKAEAEASGGSEARRSGRSSRKNKKKKGEPLKGPRIVKGSKGNVDSKVRVARRGRSTSAGEDGEGALATLAALATNRWVAGGAGVLFIVVVFGVYGLYRLVATPEEPDPGHIKITSVPPNARIELNGVDLAANTPFLIDNVQPMTPYAIELNLPNYLPKKRTNIIVQPGETLDLHFTLEPQPGKLVVSTAPPEAEVVINGEVRGVTPATIEGLPRMDDAFVRLTLRKTGFEDATVTLQWKAGTPEITHHETLRAVKKPEKDEDAEGDDEK